MASDQTGGEEFPRGAELWRNIQEAYDRAQQGGAAYSIDTNSKIVQDGGVDFVTRIASALRDKPKASPGVKNPGNARPPKNPFLPYDEQLWVQHLSASHTLLLNKFNVVPHHTLVVTREFQSQSDALNQEDLSATLHTLQAYPEGAVAFFNCGEHSGSSQPHKHLQVVPLPFADNSPHPPFHHVIAAACQAAGQAAGEPVTLSALPFQAFCCQLLPETSARDAEAALRRLLARAAPGDPEVLQQLSYNVLLTREFLMVVPRSSETCGPCNLNALAFAGTLLLRSQEEVDFVQQQGPMSVLAAVGLPW